MRHKTRKRTIDGVASCGEASTKSVPRLASAAIGFVEGSALAAPHGGDGFARDAAILQAPLDFEHGRSDRIPFLDRCEDVAELKRRKCEWHSHRDAALNAGRDYLGHRAIQQSFSPHAISEIRWDFECWMGRLLSAPGHKPASAALIQIFLKSDPRAWALAVLKLALAVGDGPAPEYTGADIALRDITIDSIPCTVESEESILNAYRHLEIVIVNHYWGAAFNCD